MPIHRHSITLGSRDSGAASEVCFVDSMISPLLLRFVDYFVSKFFRDLSENVVKKVNRVAPRNIINRAKSSEIYEPETI